MCVLVSEVLIGVSDAGIHTGHVLHQLLDVLQICTSSGEYDPTYEFFAGFIETITLDLAVHLFNDLHYPCMDDAGKVLQTDLLGFPAP